MKIYIRSAKDGPYIVSGRIASTGEKCTMKATGFVKSRGRIITMYSRVDKDVEYDEKGNPVHRQYSMDRQHRFYVETEDDIEEY